jgi:hypothetical protein
MPDSKDASPKTGLVARLPEDLRTNEAVHALLSDPLPTITAMITGALASGRQDIVLGGGRVVQAILKGRALQQLGRELEELHKKGKLREDYGGTKYGFQSLADLMAMIDSDAPDEDRLRAAKSMFVALNSANAPEGEALLRYQLFRIVLKLSGSQLVLLMICYRLFREGHFTVNTMATVQNWFSAVAGRIGHSVFSAIEQDEAVLIQHGIITARTQTDRSGVILENARLTDLGVKICSLIDNYGADFPDSSKHSA